MSAPASRDEHAAASVVVVFRSVLRDDVGPEYGALAEELAERAAGFPGFVDIRDYEGPDGERLAVIWWESHETLRAWAEDAKHRGAQRLGREKFYAWFQLEICDRVRSTVFESTD